MEPELRGQAVIDGVLMRSPRFLVVALRLPSGAIQLTHREAGKTGLTESLHRLPVVRGAVAFFGFIFQGMDALFFSGGGPERTTLDEQPGPSVGSSIATIFAAILLAFAGFVLLPRMMVLAFGPGSAFWIEGVLRSLVFVAFVALLSIMPPFRMWFEHSRAESRVVGALESGEPLGLTDVRASRVRGRFSALAFLLSAMFALLLFFGLLEPWLAGFDRFPRTMLKLVLWVAVVGGTYEAFMRFPALSARILGLLGREPSAAQLEVALSALKQALRLERGQHDEARGTSFVIRGPDELGPVASGRKPA